MTDQPASAAARDSAGSWVADPDEHLATGWEREVPSDDTVTRAYVDGFAEMAAAVALAAGGRVRRDDRVVAGDSGGPCVYLNAAMLLGPLPDQLVVATVAEVAAFFAEAPGGPWLLASPLPTPDLRPMGLQPIGHPPFMARSPGGSARPAPPDLDVVEVRDEALLELFERTLSECYPFPELADVAPGTVFPPALLDDPSFRFWVGFVGGRPIGTSAIHRSAGTFHVEYVSSAADLRGRGYGEAMTWAATMSYPDLPALLIASDAGQATYRRMGYLPVWRFTLWAGPRS